MRRLLGVFVVGLALALPSVAGAAPVTGSISFSGSAKPVGDTTWTNATGIDFGGAIVVAGSGAYSGVPSLDNGLPPGPQSVAFTDFTFNPFPAGGVIPLWTFSFGGSTYSFDLTNLSSASQDGTALDLRGSGTLSIDGDTAPGNFAFTGQGTGNPITFSFSASNGVVPEPGSMMLLGTGLFGLAGAARRRFARAAK